MTLKSRAEILLDKHFSGEVIDYRRVIAIFLPILVDQAFVVCLNLFNSAMVSSSGVAAISAVNMVDSLNIFLINVFIAVSTGGTVVVAQYKGSGNDKMISKAAAGSISTVFILAFTISMMGIIFHMPLLNLLFGKAEADVFSNAKIYIIGSCASYCGIATMEGVCGVLRGIGKTKSSLMLSVIMNLTYLVLNFILINIFHMGVLGLAFSINAARYIAAVCAVLYVTRWCAQVRLQLKDFIPFDIAMLKRIFYIGLPFASEQMFFNGGKILTQTFIVSLGTYAITTNAICASLAGVFLIPAQSISLTAVTVVGQCIGRRNTDDARKFIKSFLWTSSASFIIMALIIMPLFGPIVSLFHPPEQIVPNIFTIILINMFAQIPLWSISFVTPAALRAAGDSKFTSLVAMLSMWLFRVVFGYILGIVLHMGIVGVWLAMDCEWIIRGVVFLYRFHGNNWYRHRLID